MSRILLDLTPPRCLCGFLDHFTEEDKAKFQDDEFYRQFRRELEDELNVRVTQTAASVCLLILAIERPQVYDQQHGRVKARP